MLIENTPLHLLPHLKALVLAEVYAIHGTVKETKQLNVDTIGTDVGDKSLHKRTWKNGLHGCDFRVLVGY